MNNKETLEEVGKDFIENEMKYSFKSMDSISIAKRMLKCVVFGAEWQAEQLSKDEAVETLKKGLALLLKKQEKMYSEEEVYQLLLKFRNIYTSNEVELKKWFKQNKK